MCCTSQTTLTIIYLLVGDEELVTAAPGLPLGVEPEHGRLQQTSTEVMGHLGSCFLLAVVPASQAPTLASSLL